MAAGGFARALTHATVLIPGETDRGKDLIAAILGLHLSTLRARMHKLGIIRPETKEPD